MPHTSLHAPVWAITSYYNPAAYASRPQNFRAFRRRLQVPLVTVELAAEGRFELRPEDSDLLIQIPGGDVLWQKERLLNVALSHVPEAVRYIAWLDCDIVLERDDWPRLVPSLLQKHPLVQLFSELHDLGPHAPFPAQGQPATGQSVAHLFQSGRWTREDLRASGAIAPRRVAFGLSWAARRATLERHCLYDAMVMGSGDRALVAAAYGVFEHAVDVLCLRERRVSHYLDWASRFYCEIQGNVGCLEGRLFHLWHGDPKDRRYRERHTAFAEHAFDPEVDLCVDPHGAFVWAHGRSDLRSLARDYFLSRCEDGHG